MWQAIIALNRILSEGEGNVWNPDIGSADHKLAEKMVEKGMLERVEYGGYCIPGKLSF